MNIFSTLGFLTFGLAVGVSLSATGAAPVAPVPVPRVVQEIPQPEVGEDENALDLSAIAAQQRALGLLMAVSLHERNVARSASGRASPALLEMIRAHDRQHDDIIAALRDLGADLDSADAARLLASADYESALLELLQAGEVDDAYLMAAMKCNQRLLGLVRYRVLPALQDDASRQLARRATTEANSRLHEIRELRAQHVPEAAEGQDIASHDAGPGFS